MAVYFNNRHFYFQVTRPAFIRIRIYPFPYSYFPFFDSNLNIFSVNTIPSDISSIAKYKIFRMKSRFSGVNKKAQKILSSFIDKQQKCDSDFKVFFCCCNYWIVIVFPTTADDNPGNIQFINQNFNIKSKLIYHFPSI